MPGLVRRIWGKNSKQLWEHSRAKAACIDKVKRGEACTSIGPLFRQVLDGVSIRILFSYLLMVSLFLPNNRYKALGTVSAGSYSLLNIKKLWIGTDVTGY
jgi:hypothetical protein